MSTATLPIDSINGSPLTDEQTSYLTGFFAGAAARGLRFGDVEAAPAVEKTVALDDLIFEERVKRELHPLDAYQQLLDNAVHNKAPEKEEIFRFKWNGLFFLTPNKEAFMARLRIPGGQLPQLPTPRDREGRGRTDLGLCADHHAGEFPDSAHRTEKRARGPAPDSERRAAHARRGRGQHPQHHRESDRGDRSARAD
jgi:hypothetical protein